MIFSSVFACRTVPFLLCLNVFFCHVTTMGSYRYAARKRGNVNINPHSPVSVSASSSCLAGETDGSIRALALLCRSSSSIVCNNASVDGIMHE